VNDAISTFTTPQECGDAVEQLKQTSPDCFHFVPEQLYDSKKWVIAVYVRLISKYDKQGLINPFMQFSHFA
jgi:hypothetical protein